MRAVPPLSTTPGVAVSDVMTGGSAVVTETTRLCEAYSLPPHIIPPLSAIWTVSVYVASVRGAVQSAEAAYGLSLAPFCTLEKLPPWAV
jgi:hypothetical protein